MKVFITGGSGFLGKKVIERMLDENHSISALARSDASLDVVRGLGATAVKGDILNPKSYSESLKNIDCVVHCAAPVEFWGPWKKYQEGIVEATMSLAKECEIQGVRRFVFISSESVLQDKDDLVDIDEALAYPREANSYYGKAKKIAEELLLKFPGKMEVIILRPTFIWGQGCAAFATLAKKVNAGQFLWIDGGKANFEAVHVENVAEAVALSLTNGRDRGIYFVTDDYESTVREFFENLFRSLNLSIPKQTLPMWLAKPVANLVERIWRIFRIPGNPPLTRFDLSFIAMSRKYRIDRIKRDFGYKPKITRAEGFRQLANPTSG